MSQPTESAFTRTRKHHRDPDCRTDVIKEMEVDAAKPTGGGRFPFTPRDIQQIGRYHVVVTTPQEVAELPSKLSANTEFGVVIDFDPTLVDTVAQLGMFPMALGMGGYATAMVMGPKLHRERSFTYISKRVVAAAPSGPSGDAAPAATSPTGPSSPAAEVVTAEDDGSAGKKPNVPLSFGGRQILFDFNRLCLPKKLLKQLVVRVHFFVESGKQSISDLHQSLAMIRKQHGEDWFCSPLRSCVQHMMMAPEQYKTTFYTLVLAERDTTTSRGHATDSDSSAAFPAPATLPSIVACDMGYLVGDIMTAYTGAYEVDGTGSVTLGASAKLLELLGIPIWDLGMSMPYKEKMLHTTTKKRKQWLQTVKQHRELYAKEVEAARREAGIVDDNASSSGASDTAASAVAPPSWVRNPSPIADPTNSKSQSLLLKDPRKQALLHLLSRGVEADLFMCAHTTEELVQSVARRRDEEVRAARYNSDAQKNHASDCKNENAVASDLVSIEGVSDGADDGCANSKSQQKKAAKALAIAAKKEAKKQNGGALPPPCSGVAGGAGAPAAKERRTEQC